MWTLLSARLRTWLLIAVAFPLARTLVRRAAINTQHRRPGSPLATWLHRTDSALTAADRRRAGRRLL